MNPRTLAARTAGLFILLALAYAVLELGMRAAMPANDYGTFRAVQTVNGREYVIGSGLTLRDCAGIMDRNTSIACERE